MYLKTHLLYEEEQYFDFSIAFEHVFLLDIYKVH